MHTHTFAPIQAAHALEVVLRLMKKRRFFLYHHDKRSTKEDPRHGLDEAVFGPALNLDREVLATYKRAARLAKGFIADEEKELGLTPPEQQNVVQCNRFTGGMDICEVYPLTTFFEFAPDTYEALHNQVGKYAGRIWGELQELKVDALACVVLLRTRFDPVFSVDDDILAGKLVEFTLYPHALGYLMYEYSKRTRIVPHDFLVFGSSSRSHVEVHHWMNSAPTIGFEKTGGYTCQVYVPIVI